MEALELLFNWLTPYKTGALIVLVCALYLLKGGVLIKPPKKDDDG